MSNNSSFNVSPAAFCGAALTAAAYAYYRRSNQAVPPFLAPIAVALVTIGLLADFFENKEPIKPLNQPSPTPASLNADNRNRVSQVKLSEPLKQQLTYSIVSSSDQISAPSFAFDPNNFKLQFPSPEVLESCKINGLDEELAGKLNQFVLDCLQNPQYTLRFVKQAGVKGVLQKLEGENVQEELEVPFQLEVLYENGGLKDVLLLTDYVVAKGGETDVLLCCSLFQGEEWVIKKCSPGLQQQLLEHFRDHPSDGIIPIKGIIKNEQTGEVQSLEPFRVANLYECMKPGSSFERPAFKDRLKAAIHVLKGALAIHNTTGTIKEDDQEAISFKMFHLDLTPANILVNLDDNTGTPKDLAIIDFGCAHPENVGGTGGYKAPEQVSLCCNHKNMKKEEIINYNLKYGQKSDVWSLGLTLAALIGWNVSPLGDPPLHSIRDSIEKSRDVENPITFDKSIAKIRQQEINEDIDKLKQHCLTEEELTLTVSEKTALHNAAEVLKQMLKTEPQNRISIPQALAKLETEYRARFKTT